MCLLDIVGRVNVVGLFVDFEHDLFYCLLVVCVGLRFCVCGLLIVLYLGLIVCVLIYWSGLFDCCLLSLVSCVVL